MSRLSLRLLAFNLLLVFLPVAGMLYLDTYERQLLAAQERAMVQQGRVLAAVLSGAGEIEPGAAGRILANLERRTEARLRVVDRFGKLLADSSRLGPRREEAPAGAEPAARSSLRESPLYRLGSLLYRLSEWALGAPGAERRELASGDFYSSAERLLGGEVRAALAGRYGAATRISSGGQRSVTLYSAIPVRSGGQVVGAVLVSQSTARLLRELYEVRLRIFEVFLAAVAAAVVLSLLVSTTIARPLRRLRGEAAAFLDGRGRPRGRFRGSRRRDEIGDLARSLEQLSDRLERHLRFSEGFASDLAHELKNPLASVRSATELLAEMEDPAERRHFVAIVARDVTRMERSLSAARDLSRLDAGLEGEERQGVDLAAVAAQEAKAFRRREGERLRFEVRVPAEPVRVRSSAHRVAGLLENLLDNAASFSPAGGRVTVELVRRDGLAELAVADQGPGIPPAHLERVFDRFFTYRTGDRLAGSDNDHSGLGLAIVKAIAEAYGGSVRAENRAEGGARFVVLLPLAD